LRKAAPLSCSDLEERNIDIWARIELAYSTMFLAT
jgi:hypothetical protein